MNSDVVWTKQEDSIISKAYEKYGADWQRISSLFFNKSADQCRTRYEEALATQHLIWTAEDDESLIREVEKYSTRWRTIATILKKPADECRKRFNILRDAKIDAPSFLMKDITESVIESNEDLALIAQQRLADDLTVEKVSTSLKLDCLSAESNERYIIPASNLNLFAL